MASSNCWVQQTSVHPQPVSGTASCWVLLSGQPRRPVPAEHVQTFCHVEPGLEGQPHWLRLDIHLSGAAVKNKLYLILLSIKLQPWWRTGVLNVFAQVCSYLWLCISLSINVYFACYFCAFCPNCCSVHKDPGTLTTEWFSETTPANLGGVRCQAMGFIYMISHTPCEDHGG
jgi:hypothetical protein